jgi:hypothetical protein
MAQQHAIARRAEGMAFFGHTAMLTKTSRHRVKPKHLSEAPHWRFISAPNVAALHIGKALSKTKLAKQE